VYKPAGRSGAAVELLISGAGIAAAVTDGLFEWHFRYGRPGVVPKTVRRKRTDKPFGPFSVAPGQVSALGASFTPFVNDLLRVESSAANLDGGQLTTTYRDNIGDKGVDAGLRRAVGTKYIPSGDSAWQFKAGDLPPAKCKKELRGAEERGGSAALEGG
jgi:hypothetical protein